MTNRTLWIVSLGAALATACSDSKRESKLKRRVGLYCQDLTFKLGQAVEKYGELAPSLDSGQLSPEQRTRIESSLMIDAIGATRDARVAKMLGMNERFLFCTGVRKIDEKRRDELNARVGVLIQALREQCFDARACTLTPHVEAAKTLAQLAALAREIDQSPLVE
jgi:hypothetical protein